MPQRISLLPEWNTPLLPFTNSPSTQKYPEFGVDCWRLERLTPDGVEAQRLENIEAEWRSHLAHTHPCSSFLHSLCSSVVELFPHLHLYEPSPL